MLFGYIDSPLGPLLARGTDGALTALYLPTGRHAAAAPPDGIRDDAAFSAVRAQLEEYFAGTRTTFDLPLRATGTPFQHRVWAALREIPHGETRSYKQLAAAIGQPGAFRPVGMANGQNPISIIVPCHRVIGADGSLTGYGGGLPAKKWLLAHELAQAELPLDAVPLDVSPLDVPVSR